MRICICPLKQLYQVLKQEDPQSVAAVISTSTDGPDRALLRGIPFVCRQYRDIDYEGPEAFSSGDAQAIAEFVRGLDRQIQTVYCVCDAAMSRSPAVGAAISRFFGLDAMDTIWRCPSYKPNMLVFTKLCEALRVPVTDGEIDILMFENTNAFRSAVTAARNGKA